MPQPARTVRPRSAAAAPVRLATAVLAAAVLLLPAGAGADWLVTKEGQRIQTLGPWKVKRNKVTFTNGYRRPGAIDRELVDFEASERATAEAQRVILYSTSWCGYCRQARVLLNNLGVLFIEKDIERDREARQELDSKVGPGAGVPVLDFDGSLIRGYDEDAIRSHAARLESEDSGDAPAGASSK